MILLLSIILSPLVSAINPTIYDYVIAGGGAVGLSLAVRLSEDPSKTVVVLEAGETGFGKLNRGNFGTANDWRFVTVPQKDAGGRVQDQVQGRVLGGGSAINSGIYIRGNKAEYDALETLGAKGWNWKSMFAAVKKSEHFFPPSAAEIKALGLTFNPAYHGHSGPVALSMQALNVSNFYRDFAIPTLHNLGHEMNLDPNGGTHNGGSWEFLTALPDTNTRSYAVSGYYLPVANRTNLHVLPNSHVSRIIWSPTSTKDDLEASGVEYLALNTTAGSPARQFINAHNIILSGSALNTPKILELSGVGDPTILKRVGVALVINLPGVGSNLCNQPVTIASYLLKNGTVDAGNTIRAAILDMQPLSGFLSPSDLKRSREMLSVKPQGLSTPQFEVMKNLMAAGVPQMEFTWNIAADGNNITTLTFDRLILLKPLSRGSVHINSTNPLDPPVIDPKYLSAPHDKFIFSKAIECTRRIAATEPLKSIIEGPIVPDSTVQTEDDFIHYVNSQSQSEHHFIGTSAMTLRSLGGVVDPSLRVYGTSNVRVADLSIIANLPGIHTVSLAYMVAERAAEIIKNDL
ncbi:Alcohol dehydrogenase [acceptor] [Hypsizygus marmoreus]|uniref:Alcohol dehydrogenase [acceptor] n=1 Tax=Hypsizygus marmoreus TaxID=39966 RepID=A0A369JEV3_HYPMA|nr:Alcohol dehydrogenase [acceptor] [Hypsizygus marmoreus]